MDIPADVDLVVLFGSRARGDHSNNSDWDLAIRFNNYPQGPMRLLELDQVLAETISCSSDAIDLIDLDHASYLLQRMVAEDGKLLFERQPGLFMNFCSRAIRQWADWERRQTKLSQERLTPAA